MSETNVPLDPVDVAILDAVANGELDDALSDDERALIRSGKVRELLIAEQRHGGGVLDVHPEFADAARALQHARAAYAASKLGLRLCGNGRPLPGWLVDELGRVLRRVLVGPS